MIGTTLSDIREQIEALACQTGEYYLVCGRYGDRPVPAAGLTFDTRQTARSAARATEQYRAILRQYDPRLTEYDVIVCQEPSEKPPSDRVDVRDGAATETSRAAAGSPGATSQSESLVEFAHGIVGAVFETIAASSHDALEDTIIDTYRMAAKSIERPEERCLRLLGSVAIELGNHCESDELVRILRESAQRLQSPSATAEEAPLASTLSRLQTVALLEEYTLRPRGTDPIQERQEWEVFLTDYELGRPHDGIITLPLVVELFRRNPDPCFSVVEAESLGRDAGADWRITLTTSIPEDPPGVVNPKEPPI